MPSTKWKLRTQREKWYAGETISVAIGAERTFLTHGQTDAHDPRATFAAVK